MRKKKMDLEIVNPNAAGIDVGSRSHFVAKGQQTDDVREFGVCASDHEEMISWLKKYGIKTIAMESTGSYWQNLFSALQGAGFEVSWPMENLQKISKGKRRTFKTVNGSRNFIP